MLMQPQASAMKDRFSHDKLNTSDIAGTVADTYGKYRRLEGRNYMDMSDIEKTKPK